MVDRQPRVRLIGCIAAIAAILRIILRIVVIFVALIVDAFGVGVL